MPLIESQPVTAQIVKGVSQTLTDCTISGVLTTGASITYDTSGSTTILSCATPVIMAGTGLNWSNPTLETLKEVYVNKDTLSIRTTEDMEIVINIDGLDHTFYNKIDIKVQPSKRYLMQQKIRDNLADNRKHKAIKNILKSHQLAELKAQETLRDIISERDWRCYITNGYIMVKGGSSTRWYQIFRDERITVYEQGKKVCRLCIHTSKECPPTDHVINMKTLAEIDEEAIWAGANVHELNPLFADRVRR